MAIIYGDFNSGYSESNFSSQDYSIATSPEAMRASSSRSAPSSSRSAASSSRSAPPPPAPTMRRHGWHGGMDAGGGGGLMAGGFLELLARSHVPQPDRAVARPTDKQGGIRWIETDAPYRTAAIFSNVSFTGMCVCLCVCVCVYMYICSLHTHTHTHTHTHIHIWSQVMSRYI